LEIEFGQNKSVTFPDPVSLCFKFKVDAKVPVEVSEALNIGKPLYRKTLGL
jgi:hypothetical protein